MLRVTCFGAAGSVTGSDFLIESSSGKRLVVDCGLFQGSKEEEARNREPWGYDVTDLQHIALTHAHIDHSGRIPKIVKDGFRGSIVASPPTTELCEIMLPDSGHVQEMEAGWRSKKNRRKAKSPVPPLYTTEDALESLQYFRRIDMDTVVELEPGIKIRMRNAGHILGSCIAELWIDEGDQTTKVVFSGDLGKQDPLIVKDPYDIEEADYVFIESTYGARFHRSLDESKAELLEAVQYAIRNNEKVIIPAFAVERTQEILYILAEFFREAKLPRIPVYLDSPLAIRATAIFRRNAAYFDEPATLLVNSGNDPLDMPNLKCTLSAQESMEINSVKGPAVIISANGMCTAGRIKHHLKHNLWRPGASIVFVGFQGQGTTGRRIIEGAKKVKIFGEEIAVKAKVFTIGGLSAHADQGDLLTWLGRFTKLSRPKVFVIHGEPEASQAFAKVVRERFGLETQIPRRLETLSLPPVRAKGLPDEEGVSLGLLRDVEDEITRLQAQFDTLKQNPTTVDPAKLQALREALRGL